MDIVFKRGYSQLIHESLRVQRGQKDCAGSEGFAHPGEDKPRFADINGS
jgi:hypothetical protein